MGTSHKLINAIAMPNILISNKSVKTMYNCYDISLLRCYTFDVTTNGVRIMTIIYPRFWEGHKHANLF